MFTKKEKLDKYGAQKAVLRIAARRLLAANPEAAIVLKSVCLLQNKGHISDLVDLVEQNNASIFQKDPMLKEDIKDILVLLGLDEISPDIIKFKALIPVVCDLV